MDSSSLYAYLFIFCGITGFLFDNHFVCLILQLIIGVTIYFGLLIFVLHPLFESFSFYVSAKT